MSSSIPLSPPGKFRDGVFERADIEIDNNLYARWTQAGASPGAWALSNDDLTATCISPNANGYKGIKADQVISGKCYWEWELPDPVIGGDYCITGSGPSSIAFSGQSDGSGGGGISMDNFGNLSINGGGYSQPFGAKTARVYMFGYDADTGQLWIGWDGVWTTDPLGSHLVGVTGVTTDKVPWLIHNHDIVRGVITARFGDTGFNYPVPAGFKEGIYQVV